MDHTLVARDASTSLVKSRLKSGRIKEGRIRILVGMEKDENKHRVRTWYVEKSIDEGEVSLKDDDEGKASKGGTPEKQEPRVTSSEDVHMSDPLSSSNIAMRGTAKRHDDEQGREEVTRSKTSSDDSNLVRGTVRSRNDEEIFEDTKKPKLRCLNL